LVYVRIARITISKEFLMFIDLARFNEKNLWIYITSY
jgi:hypothetical protein